MSRLKYVLAILVVGTVGVLIFYATQGTATQQPAFDEAVMYHTPTCQCCVEHGKYLEEAGVNVEFRQLTRRQLKALKVRHGIPRRARGCHSLEIRDRLVEGHVPIDVINAFLAESEAPALALPGMPQGSPGMSGPKQGPWEFYTIDQNRQLDRFMSR